MDDSRLLLVFAAHGIAKVAFRAPAVRPTAGAIAIAIAAATATAHAGLVARGTILLAVVLLNGGDDDGAVALVV